MKKLLFFLSSIACALAPPCAEVALAQVDQNVAYGDSHDAYVWSNSAARRGLVKLNTAEFDPQLVFSSEITAKTATYGADGFYVLSGTDLMRYDLLSGSATTVCQLPSSVQDLAFNHADGRLYAVVSNDSYGQLSVVDTQTGELTKTLDFSYRYSGNYKMVRIAFTSSGEMFGVMEYASYGTSTFYFMEISEAGECNRLHTFSGYGTTGYFIDVDPRDDRLYCVYNDYYGATLSYYANDGSYYPFVSIGSSTDGYEFVGLYSGYRVLSEDVTAYPLPFTCRFVSQAEFDLWTAPGWALGDSKVSTTGDQMLLSPAILVDQPCKVEVSVEANGDYNVYCGSSSNLSEADRKASFSGNDRVVVDAAAGNMYVGIRNTGSSLDVSSVTVARYVNGVVYGNVSCAGAPIADVTISIDGNPLASTDNLGNYRIAEVAPGTHTISASNTYYIYSEKSFDLPDLGEKQVNFQLTERDINVISASVTSDGAPLAGALVKLEAPVEIAAFTGADGSVEFIDVPKGTFDITVSKNGYESKSLRADVAGRVAIPATDLSKIASVARQPEAEAAGNNVTVNWQPAENVHTIVYDNGVPYVDENGFPGALGFETSYGTNILGTVFRQPALVYDVDWYSAAGTSGRAESANILIIDLDENGRPNGEILGSAMETPIVDGWNHVVLPDPVDAPNGFLVGITSNGHIALAFDNGDDSMPHRSEVSAYANFYSDPLDYHYYDYVSTLPTRRLMIRPTVANLEPAGTELPVNASYDIFRLKAADKDTPDAWTAIASAQARGPIKDVEVPHGVFNYAIVANYGSSLVAQPVFTNTVEIAMKAALTINYATNIGVEAAEGAIVTLSSPSRKYTGVVKSGVAKIYDVYKDLYDIRIRCRGLDDYVGTLDLDVAETSIAVDLSTCQALDPPSHVDIVADEKGSAKTLVWDVQPNIIDNFDGIDHADWAINSPGDCGWLAVDADGFNTWPFGYYTFPGEGSPMATLIVNQNALTPKPGEYPYRGRPLFYSGERSLAFVAAYPEVDEEGYMTVRNSDDYLISPELDFYKDFSLKFMARSHMTDENGLYEQMRVGYSTGSADPDDFVWISDLADVPDQVSDDAYWTPYSFSLPKEAKRVAINSQSRGIFMLLVDDLFIGTDSQVCASSYKPLRVLGYKLAIDGVDLGSFSTNSYDLADLPVGSHSAAVKAVYATGESEPLEIEFKVLDPAAVDAVLASSATVAARRGAVDVAGADQTVVYSLNGFAVATLSGSGSVCLPAGVYIVVADGKPYKLTVR